MAAPLFKAFAAQWVEESRSGWKASTRQQYGQVLKSKLLPLFGELRVTQVTEPRVRQAITQWQDGGLSARRTNLVLLVLKMILKTARRRRWLREDPLVAVKMLREPQTEIEEGIDLLRRERVEGSRSELVEKDQPVTEIWCRRGDSNPHGLPHTPLKRARLPVPPLRRNANPEYTATARG